MILYHGSSVAVRKPLYGYGKKTNDYGQGFYCTEDAELAKEWACLDERGGILNTYAFRTEGLVFLDLNQKTIVEWLAVLLHNRSVRYANPVERRTAEYLISHYLPDTAPYDVITGYRADDSYFSYARAFLSNTISLRQLGDAMRLGNLGTQVFLQSEKAFAQLSFIESASVEGEIYYPRRYDRDDQAKKDYHKLLESGVTEGIFANDILRKEMKLHDLCIS